MQLEKYKNVIIGSDYNLVDLLKVTPHNTTKDFAENLCMNGLFPSISRPTRVTFQPQLLHFSFTCHGNVLIGKSGTTGFSFMKR